MKKYLEIEDAKLIFKNFAGRERKFNPAGKRNFSVVLDQDVAMQLMEDGWNIKQLAPRDPSDVPTYFLQVTVAYNYHPPKVIVISGNTKTELDESQIDMIDDADIACADIVINPSHYEINGKSGIKAYLKQAYITLEQSSFDKKYDSIGNSPIPDDEEVPF